MKRSLAFLLILALSLSLHPFAALAEGSVPDESIPLPPVAEDLATSGDFEYSVTDGKATVTGYTGAGGEVVIPETLGGYHVTTIGENAFYMKAKVTSVTLSFGIKEIGYHAFYMCTKLASVRIPATVLSVDDSAFTNCGHLATIYFGGTESRWKAMTKNNDTIFMGVSIVYVEGNPLWGDANDDGSISSKDIVRLKNYLANYDEDTGLSTETLGPGADANGDGVISSKDIVRLKNYLANYDDETETSSVTLGPNN